MAMRGISRIVFRKTSRGLLFQQEDNKVPQSKLREGRLSSFLLCPYESWKFASYARLGGQCYMSTNIRRKRHTREDKNTIPMQEQDVYETPTLTFGRAGERVMEEGYADFPDARAAQASPLAKSLFDIHGVTRVFYGPDLVTITKSEEYSWDYLRTEIDNAIKDFFSSGKPLFLDSQDNLRPIKIYERTSQDLRGNYIGRIIYTIKSIFYQLSPYIRG